MKKILLLPLFLLIGCFWACSSNENEVEEPSPSPVPIGGKVDWRNVDSVFVYYGIDTSKITHRDMSWVVDLPYWEDAKGPSAEDSIYLIGLKDYHPWVAAFKGGYMSTSKKLFEFTDPDKINKIYRDYRGYGEYKDCPLGGCRIYSNVIYLPKWHIYNMCFYYAGNNGLGSTDGTRYKSLWVKNNDDSKGEFRNGNVSYYMPWTENTMLIGVDYNLNLDYNSPYYCYTIQGDSLYRWGIWKSDIYKGTRKDGEDLERFFTKPKDNDGCDTLLSYKQAVVHKLSNELDNGFRERLFVMKNDYESGRHLWKLNFTYDGDYYTNRKTVEFRKMTDRLFSYYVKSVTYGGTVQDTTFYVDIKQGKQVLPENVSKYFIAK